MIGEVIKLVGFPRGEERKLENLLSSENEADIGSRRTVRYFSHPHSADEIWSFVQSHTSSMKRQK